VLARLVSLVAPPLCAACGGDAGRAPPLCGECRLELARSRCTAQRDGVWAAYGYDGPAGALVRSFKFSGRIGLAQLMAAQLAALAPPALLHGALVPVPLHPRRRRRRGFNHAAALAAALGRRTGLPVADCLYRMGDPAPQAGRGRRARLRAVAGTVGAAGAVPEWALLVDDVVTTGATLAACAQALRAAGCREVAALTYARTPGR
jgi:ComF family protein